MYNSYFFQLPLHHNSQINKTVLSMLGRRSIRIKTMQAIYSLQTNEFLSLKDANKMVNTSIENFISMYEYCLYTFYKVVKYTETDAEIKASKLLSQNETVNAKMLSNPFFIALDENDNFETITEKKKFNSYLDDHTLRTVYHAINESEAFEEYLHNKLSTIENDYKIASVIINKILVKNEVFLQNVEDHFINYEDDFGFVKKLLQKQLKEVVKTLDDNSIFFKRNSFYDELVEFSRDLLNKTIDHSDALDDEIKGYLVNWDVERLALVDVILLKMALCEFLFFQEIPTKVTMNEYIDISKQYSTPKSKEFINGVLDRMMKKLTEKGRIKKTGRGLQ